MPAASPPSGSGPGAHLRALGLELPTMPKPLGNYVEVSQAGSLLQKQNQTLTASKGEHHDPNQCYTDPSRATLAILLASYV
jgi:hypothetical protein